MGTVAEIVANCDAEIASASLSATGTAFATPAPTASIS